MTERVLEEADQKQNMTKHPRLSRDQFDVAIVGGGLVGAVAGLCFERFGGDDFQTLILERGPFAALGTGVGRAYALSHSSKVLFEMLGLWEAMAPFAQPIVDIDITDSVLESPLRPVFLQFSGEIALGQVGAYIIEHEALAGPVYKALGEADNVTVLDECAFGGFHAEPQNVTLRVDGAEVAADLLIGADGRGSQVREGAEIKVHRSDYEQDGVVVTVDLSKPHEGRAVQHFLPSGPFAILPLPGDQASLVWTEKRGVAGEMCALADEAFEAEINKRFSPRLGTVKLAGPRQHFPLSLLLAHSFIADRVALIGDAAHGVHPLAGQGMNIGFRDVAALVEIVLETRRLGLDFGNAVALERYQQWRRFDGVMSAFAMDGLNRLFSNDNGFLQEVRGFGLRLVDRLPPLKAFFVKEAAGVNGDVPLLMQGKPLC